MSARIQQMLGHGVALWGLLVSLALGCKGASEGSADLAAGQTSDTATLADAAQLAGDATASALDPDAADGWAFGRAKPSCLQSSDCPLAPPCRMAACVAGHCTVELAKDGQPCGTAEALKGCGPAVCTLGNCVAPSELPKRSWGEAAMVVPLALCSASGGAVGWAQIPGQLGHAAWLGPAPSNQSGVLVQVAESVLWQDGYAAAWQACADGNGSSAVLAGWRKASAQGPRQAVVATFANHSLKDLQVHAGTSDTEWTAIAHSYADTVIAGTAMQVATGQDVRVLWKNADTPREFPLPGDQYAPAVVQVEDGSAILCGYQATGNAPADGWIARVNAAGQLLWQAAIGGEGIQRFHSCRGIQNVWQIQAKVSGTVVAVGTTHIATKEGPLPKPWLVAFSVATGAVVWERELDLTGGHPAELRYLSGYQVNPSNLAWAAGYVRKKNVEYPWLVAVDETGLPRSVQADAEPGRIAGIELANNWGAEVLLHRPAQTPSTIAELRNSAGKRACHCPGTDEICLPAAVCQLRTCGCPESGKLLGEPCTLPSGTAASCGLVSCEPKP